MAKLVIAALKLGIGYPDWETVALGEHTTVDLGPERGRERIGAGPECSDPEGLFKLVCDAIDGIPETAIAVRVLLDGPRPLNSSRPDERLVIRTLGGGTRGFALYACRGTVGNLPRKCGVGRARDGCIVVG